MFIRGLLYITVVAEISQSVRRCQKTVVSWVFGNCIYVFILNLNELFLFILPKGRGLKHFNFLKCSPRTVLSHIYFVNLKNDWESAGFC